MKAYRYRAVRFDLLDNQQPSNRKSNFMDMTHSSGFAFLDMFGNFDSSRSSIACTKGKTIVVCFFQQLATAPVRPRLAILCLLGAVRGNFACHFGVKCSSFSKMNTGTSMRSPCASIGYFFYRSVHVGNQLVERIGLLFVC